VEGLQRASSILVHDGQAAPDRYVGDVFEHAPSQAASLTGGDFWFDPDEVERTLDLCARC
jgi:hypothetical protein